MINLVPSKQVSEYLSQIEYEFTDSKKKPRTVDLATTVQDIII